MIWDKDSKVGSQEEVTLHLGVAEQEGSTTSRQRQDLVYAKERKCLTGGGRRGFQVLSLRWIRIGWGT